MLPPADKPVCACLVTSCLCIYKLEFSFLIVVALVRAMNKILLKNTISSTVTTLNSIIWTAGIMTVDEWKCTPPYTKSCSLESSLENNCCLQVSENTLHLIMTVVYAS